MRLHQPNRPALDLEPDRPDWHHHAACATPEGRAVHDNAISHDTAQAANAAKNVCNGCPVILPCRREYLTEPDGVWGGLDRHQRAALAHGTDPNDPPILGACRRCGRAMMPPHTLSSVEKPLATLWRAQGYVTAADGSNGKGGRHIRDICTGCCWRRRRKVSAA